MTAAATAAPSAWRDLAAKVETFKLLADATRLATLGLLADRPRNVTELCAALSALNADAPPVGQPALSHHLALLRVGGLVESTRSGKHNIYDLTEHGTRLVAEAVAAA